MGGRRFTPAPNDAAGRRRRCALREALPRPALLERAAAGREAIDRGADPVLVLSLVVWPTEAVVAATASRSSLVRTTQALSMTSAMKTPPLQPSAPTGRSRPGAVSLAFVPKPIGLVQWRTTPRVPLAKDHLREDAFLEQHIDSGALIHQAVAETLVDALRTEPNLRRREPLALRVFSEYVGALETFGAWGWAIRHRSQAPLLLDAFISYTVSDVAGFYRLVGGHSGELSSLLALPPTETITDALRKTGHSHAELLAETDRLFENFRTAATHYDHPQASFVTTYNKAKHGAPIVREDTLDSDQFLLIAPERDSDTVDRYAFYGFRSSDAFVKRTLELVDWVTHSTQALVGFTRKLKAADLLYP